MGGNSFGNIFRITTFGESHGEGIGVVVDACPSRIPLASEDFAEEMARRRPGARPGDTPRREKDRVEVLSGVFEGLTTGAPITLYIRNRDVRSKSYDVLQTLFRPGHGDFTYYKKYGHFDYRGAGRYSARETAARVAAGVVAGKILAPDGIRVFAHTIQLGGITATEFHPEHIKESPLGCADREASRLMEEAVARVRKEGDSLGGVVEIRAVGCPAGLGEPVFDKLSADFAKAVMSVGAVKGVEIGAGFEAARLKGSQNNDPITPEGFSSNRAGGILAGISTGDEIVLRAAVKPIPSIYKEQDTVDRSGYPAKLRLDGRFDTVAIPRILPVLEAMVKIVLVDHLLRARAMNQPA